MNRRSFFTRAAQVIAGAIVVLKSGTLVPKPRSMYRTYVMGRDAILYDKEFMKSLKSEFKWKDLETCRTIPMHTEPVRQFFQYEVKQ